MRKLCFIMIAVLLSCFCLSCDTGGNIDDIQYSKDDYLPGLGRFAGLDEDTEWQIVQAYYTKLKKSSKHRNLSINDVRVEQYYGSYCPGYLVPNLPSQQYKIAVAEYLDPKNHIVTAVRMSPTGMDYGTEQRDVRLKIPYYNIRAVIRYNDDSAILIWDKGNLYDIEKDLNYYSTLLLQNDHYRIINWHNGLDFKTDALIREDLGKFIFSGWPEDEYVYILMKYLGTYNGYTALNLYSGGHSTAIHEQIIGGVHFVNSLKEQRVLAWKEGKIYKLEDLYDQGLITREDLVEMAYFHYAARDGEDSIYYVFEEE